MKSVKIGSAANHVRSVAIAIILLGCLISSLATTAWGQNGWAVGSRGTILFTSTGGRSSVGPPPVSGWRAQTSPTTADLESVCALSDGSVAWAVGDAENGSGTILRGEVGLVGIRPAFLWAKVPGVINQDLKRVFFVDGENGWAVGKGGTILYSNGDGARGWVQQSGPGMLNPPTTQDLYGLSFVRQSYGKVMGWAVGANGTVVTFTGKFGKNGKVTGAWSAASLNGGRGTLWAVSARDVEGTTWAYAVGDNRVGMWQFSNHRKRGDAAWQEFTSPSAVADLRAVRMISPTNVWLGQAKRNENVENWDATKGPKWTNRSVTGNPPFKYVFGISSISGRLGPQIWVVGSLGHIGYWDGSAWTRQDTGNRTLSSIVMLEPKRRPVQLDPSTSPDTAGSGVSYVSVSASGFPEGNITAENVRVEISQGCHEAALASTSAVSVVSASSDSNLISFLLPSGLAPGQYFVSISDSEEGDANFESSNCSVVNIAQ
jgi:hypothetical protein